MSLENGEKKTDGRKNRFVLWVILSVVGICVVIAAVLLIVLQSPEKRVRRQLDRAESYLAEAEYEQAVAAYRAALKIDPKNIDAYLGLAESYCEMEEYQKANKVLQEGYDLTENERLEKKRERVELLISATEGGSGEDKGLRKTNVVIKQIVYQNDELLGELDYRYDDRGRLSEMESFSGEDGEHVSTGIATYEYDDEGYLVKEIMDDSMTVTFDRNGNGTEKRYDDRNAYSYSYEFDKKGRISRVTTYWNRDESTYTDYEYNKDGQAIKGITTNSDWEDVENSAEATYDKYGNVTQLLIHYESGNDRKIRIDNEYAEIDGDGKGILRNDLIFWNEIRLFGGYSDAAAE